jgi:DNA-binding GntR family transcriptional regulator
MIVPFGRTPRLFGSRYNFAARIFPTPTLHNIQTSSFSYYAAPELFEPRDLASWSVALQRAVAKQVVLAMPPADGARDGTFRVPRIIASELARTLEEQIIFGVLAPGMRLIEEDIVDRYRVSRSPVREALRMLEHDGLVVRQARRSIRVSELSVEDLDDLYNCRIPLESQAAEAASLNHGPAHIATLEAALQQLRQTAGEPRACFEASLRFYNAVHEASCSRTLQRLLSSVGKHSCRYRYRTYVHQPDVMDVCVQGSVDIVDAIARRDAPTARALTAGLMERVRDSHRRVMIEHPTAR